MDVMEIRRQVAGLFRQGARRSCRVGVEQELLCLDMPTGAAVPIEVIRRVSAGTSYAGHLGFEPGGQVELSLPCAATAWELGNRLVADVTELRTACAVEGVGIVEEPVDPRPESALPLQLTSPRYAAMQAHFDAIGLAGRRMMRRTASTQVCLDWWPGEAGREQWRLLNLAGPVLAAALARSTGPESRLATWLAVDPARTAFDERLVDDPVDAYADLAAGATVFTTPGDVAEHLTTLFPPVRPRGHYLEVRFLDVQPSEHVGAVVGMLGRLLYDDEVRADALRRMAGMCAGLAEHWESAALGDPGLQASGLDLMSLALWPQADSVLGGAA